VHNLFISHMGVSFKDLSKDVEGFILVEALGVLF
jgi:hypothetical protein